MDQHELIRDVDREFFEREVGLGSEKLMNTTYQKILEEREAKGRTEGKAEGMATVLLAQLAERFGPLSETIVRRVRSASVEELEQWSVRMLREPTLERVLDSDGESD